MGEEAGLEGGLDGVEGAADTGELEEAIELGTALEENAEPLKRVAVRVGEAGEEETELSELFFVETESLEPLPQRSLPRPRRSEEVGEGGVEARPFAGARDGDAGNRLAQRVAIGEADEGNRAQDVDRLRGRDAEPGPPE